MKLVITFALMLGSFSSAFATGPTDTIIKSAVYNGTIVDHAGNSSDKVCKLVIQQIKFSNDEYPNGPIGYQRISFRLYTGTDNADLANKPVWDAKIVERTNETNILGGISNTSPVPMKTGLQKAGSSTSIYDGKTLYGKESNNDEAYTGSTETWISNISSNVFDSKPSDVRVKTKGGMIFQSTKADFSCSLY